MSIDLKVYDNGDHTCLVWLPVDLKPIPGCRGFTIKRSKNGKEDFLHGFVGFSDDQKLDPTAPWKMPVLRYMWWDYDVTLNDKVQYQVNRTEEKPPSANKPRKAQRGKRKK